MDISLADGQVGGYGWKGRGHTKGLPRCSDNDDGMGGECRETMTSMEMHLNRSNGGAKTRHPSPKIYMQLLVWDN